MEDLENNGQRIDEYLLGHLDQQQQNDFEEDLKSVPNLQDILDERNMLIEGVEAFNRQELRNQLKNIHQKHFDTTSNRPTATRRRLFVRIAAAAAAVLLLFTTFLRIYDAPANTADLYSENLQAYDLSLTIRDQIDEQQVRLEMLYSKGEYQAAIPLFEELLTNSKDKSKLRLGAGIAHLELNQTKEALVYFNTIIESNDFLY